MRKLIVLMALLALSALMTAPVMAQTDDSRGNKLDIHWLALAMAIAAAGCGYAQSKALTAGCEGVSRNPGSQDTVRFFIILGLAFIEFLALLTFVVVLFLLPGGGAGG